MADDLYDRVPADAELAVFFKGTNASRSKGVQVEFFGAAPGEYQGRSMKVIAPLASDIT